VEIFARAALAVRENNPDRRRTRGKKPSERALHRIMKRKRDQSSAHVIEDLGVAVISLISEKGKG
jgi:hypothetical protein